MMKIWSLIAIGISIWVTASPPVGAATPKNDLNDDVAIIIGNKSYLDNDIPEVTFAHNDAQAMKLFVQNVLNIREENILYLEDATQAQMESAFGRAGNHRGKAFQYVKPEVSNLYVFYSGHGVPGLQDQKSYLLPVDAEIETAEINGFPLDVLYENLSRVEARSVSIFLDACFSGNSHGGPLIRNASGAQIVMPSNLDETSNDFSILTAATNDQLASWDEENQHGLFTEYLMRAFYGQADFDSDGEINLEEVKTYLKRDMRYKARRTYNREQIPTFTGNGDRVMVAAINGAFPSRPSLASPEPEEEPQSFPETELIGIDQDYFVLKNANVRILPDVSSKRVDLLMRGEKVFVSDKVKNEPWYMVELWEGQNGFVYETLLSATEPETQKAEDIEALRERLRRLEEQTKIATPDTLPNPPVQDEPASEQAVFGPQPNWSFEDVNPKEKVEDTLKSMGALLARQSFINKTPDGRGKTLLKYNWIRVNAHECSLNASVSFYHDQKLRNNGANRAIDIHDRQISFSFIDQLHKPKTRNLKTRDTNGRLLQETQIFRLKPFAFTTKKDRRLFVNFAKDLRDLCLQVEEEFPQVMFEPVQRQRPTEMNFPRRPPPPQGHRRPPPPRR